METMQKYKISKKSVNTGIAIIVILLLALPLWSGSAGKTFVVTFMYYMALGQMWNLMAGYAGLVTFGQQLFVGLGGYSLAILSEKIGISIWLVLPISAIVGGIFAVPIGFITFRLKEGYFAIGTWVVAEVFRLVMGNWEYAGYAVGMYIKSARKIPENVIYFLAVFIGLASAFLVVRILKSKMGLNLMAIRDGEIASQGLGVNVYRNKMVSFIIASAGTAVIGVLIYTQSQFIQPNEAFSLNWSVIMSFMVIVGGLGTIEGPIIGALLYVLLQQYLSQLGPVSLIVLGLISVLTMLYAPKGLYGVFASKFNLNLFFTKRMVNVDKYKKQEKKKYN